MSLQWEWRWVYNGNEDKFTMEIKMSLQWKWRWVYNGNVDEITMGMKMSLQWEWRWVYNGNKYKSRWMHSRCGNIKKIW